MSKRKNKIKKANAPNLMDVSENDIRVLLLLEDRSHKIFKVAGTRVWNSIIHFVIEEKEGLLRHFQIKNSSLSKAGGDVSVNYQMVDKFEMSLANDRRVIQIIFLILLIAQTGGMSKKRGEDLFLEFMSSFRSVHAQEVDSIFEELQKIMEGEIDYGNLSVRDSPQEAQTGLPAEEGQPKTEK